MKCPHIGMIIILAPGQLKIKASKTIIGFSGLSYRMYGKELKLNVGYRFDKDFWGQGYATELAAYTINYGFSKLQKNQIFAIVRPKHAASIKVLEKCNMKLLGKLDDVPNEENSLVYIIENPASVGKATNISIEMS